MQIYINNKLMNVVGRGLERDGFQRVRVAEPGGPPCAEHLIPCGFLNNERSCAVFTGGNWYSRQPREAPAVAPLPESPKVELQVIPVISTSHLSEEANRWLEEWGSAHEALVLAQYDEGFFLKVLDGHDADSTLRQSIRDVAAWAKQNSFTWVRLDRDAEQVDGLTSYDW